MSNKIKNNFSFYKYFSTKIKTFLICKQTTKKHYIENFSLLYYLIFNIKLIIFLFYFYYISLDIDHMNKFSNFFYGITYVFISIWFFDLLILLYIIIFNNNISTIEVLTNVCYQCVVKGFPIACAIYLLIDVRIVYDIKCIIIIFKDFLNK